nr:extensin family protein [Rhizobium setariae]
MPEQGPVPISRPGQEKAPADQPDERQKVPDASKPDSQVEVEEPVQIQTEDPAQFAACLADLRSLGVIFEQSDRIDDGNGCGIDLPVTVTSLGSGVSLKPKALLRCATALKLAEWTAQAVVPSLKVARPKETLAAINQASGYVCRNRNGAKDGKISEHARGNAVDVAGFTFRSGKTFSIEPRMEDSTMDGAFQRAITAAACLHFTTVLDPGSDAAHETHLHLDILQRKGGYRYCW